jgi:hypothetical protein
MAAFFLPAWLVFVIGLLLVLRLRLYFEFFILVLLLDFLYAPSPGMVAGVSLWYTLVGAALFVIIEFIKRRLFVYHR